MANFKSLASDTIIYGGSNILVRLLNWLLMPYYIRTMSEMEYGVVSQVYSYIGVFLVILTYGLETAFFRFAKNKSLPVVFTTSIVSIFSTGLLFVVSILVFKHEISIITKIQNTSLLVYVAFILFIDAISSIIFAKLRLEGKSIKFGLLKLLNVLILIFFNLYFLYWIPNYSSIYFFREINILLFLRDESSYVFFSNLIASFSILILLIPEFFNSISSYSFSTLKQMLKYSYPILIVGITGMININLDKILIPFLSSEGFTENAIYSANFKIGVLMAMFTQSFRYAFEPFFFKHHHNTSDTSIYNKILLYFILFGLLIFIGVTFSMDIINLFLTESYKRGNVIIPIVLLAQLFSGIYFTLSVWYKISDKTKFGAYMGIIGSLITIVLNFLLYPYLGILGTAISGLVCFSVMVLVSIYLGNKHYKIYYNWNKILYYSGIALIIYFTGIFLLPKLIAPTNLVGNVVLYILRLILIIVFLAIVYFKEIKNNLLRNVS